MRRTIMRTSIRSASAIAAVLLLALGCGTTQTTTEREPEETEEPEVEDPGGGGRPPLDEPPEVTVRSGTRTLKLDAYTYCYGNVCADGFPTEAPPDIGEASEALIGFPERDWTFQATFERVGERCGRQQTVELEPVDDDSWVLQPHGPAGTYDVTLFGRGSGDLFTVFRWTTPSDGPLTTPAARLALVAENAGERHSYGVELMLENLAQTPDEATATITTTAANGESSTFTSTSDDGRCWAEGTVYWDGPDAEGVRAADLGPAPFTYRVEVVLDGQRHVATATWPGDEIEGNEPSVALTFEPALPAQS
jgi:hypothetical protein